MNKIGSLVVAGCMLSFSAATFAQEVSTGQGAYVGLKTGSMDIDISAYNTKTPFGIMGGYSFTESLALELEYTKTDFDLMSASGDLTTFAIYGAYRTKGDLYLKSKIGYLSENIEVASISMSDSGISLGLGLGYKFSQFSVEAEYTIIEQDVDFLSIGLNYHF